MIAPEVRSCCCFFIIIFLFCEATGSLCFRLLMTLLPVGLKVRVDSSSPALFRHLRAMILRVISGCWNRASSPDHSPQNRARYRCTSRARESCSSLFRTSDIILLMGFIFTHSYHLRTMMNQTKLAKDLVLLHSLREMTLTLPYMRFNEHSSLQGDGLHCLG